MARIKGPRKVHRYGADFKVKAVMLSRLPGVLVQDVAEALDLHPFMLSRWRKEARPSSSPSSSRGRTGSP
ncbi:MAG: transposase [Acidobacteriota bacterium]